MTGLRSPRASLSPKETASPDGASSRWQPSLRGIPVSYPILSGQGWSGAFVPPTSVKGPIVKQGPQPGSQLPVGSSVWVTLDAHRGGCKPSDGKKLSVVRLRCVPRLRGSGPCFSVGTLD